MLFENMLFKSQNEMYKTIEKFYDLYENGKRSDLKIDTNVIYPDNNIDIKNLKYLFVNTQQTFPSEYSCIKMNHLKLQKIKPEKNIDSTISGIAGPPGHSGPPGHYGYKGTQGAEEDISINKIFGSKLNDYEINFTKLFEYYDYLFSELDGEFVHFKISNLINYINIEMIIKVSIENQIFIMRNCFHINLQENKCWEALFDNIIGCASGYEVVEKIQIPNDILELRDVPEVKRQYQINFVSTSPNGYKRTSYDVDMEKMENWENLEENYGKDFPDFYNQLKYRLKSSDNAGRNGLYLFHGLPGTGKTFCIKNLMADLTDDVEFLFMPPSIVDILNDPGFSTWFLREALSINEQGKNFILVIEEAERILKSREDGNNGLAISNILNMTDGILSDITNTKIIATFNTTIDHLDKALLREGRLSIERKFSTLSEDQVLKLLDIFKLNKEDDEVYKKFLKCYENDPDEKDRLTTAEFYSRKSEISTLKYVKPEAERKLGF